MKKGTDKKQNNSKTLLTLEFLPIFVYLLLIITFGIIFSYKIAWHIHISLQILTMFVNIN
jgi:hypothetical protein